MRTNHVLIDFENVHVKSLKLLEGEHFRVMVFLGPKNTKLPVDLVLAMQAFGTRGQYVMLESPGANALDFHVAFHLGRLTTEDPSGFFHIISKDTGFDPLIQHLKTRKVFSARSPSIEEMPCFRAASPAAPVALAVQAQPNEHRVADTGRFDELCTMAIAQLVAMKRARPDKLCSLHSTIQTKLGKGVAGSTVEMVCFEQVKRGVVKVAGGSGSLTRFPDSPLPFNSARVRSNSSSVSPTSCAISQTSCRPVEMNGPVESKQFAGRPQNSHSRCRGRAAPKPSANRAQSARPSTERPIMIIAGARK